MTTWHGSVRSDEIEWRIVTPNKEEIAKLKEAGFSPRIARIWLIDLGCSTTDALRWTALGFRPATARPWIAQGFRPERAAQLLALGVTPARARSGCYKLH